MAPSPREGGGGGGAAQPAKLVCVFVLRFDTKEGNVLEWSHPQGMLGLDGLEFKGIPSGLHAVKADRVFVKQAGYYGVACFSNTPTEEAGKRGARMCSVGCLMDAADGVHALVEALSEESQAQNADAIAGTRDYTRLTELFRAHSAAAPAPVPPTPAASPSSFSSLVQFFGPSIFLLWKAALLRKRILFFSPVPIEQGCSRVRWMGKTLGLEGGGEIAPPSLLYYVNVFDIDMLSSTASYIACTSEKIFAEKPQLYDLYVNNREITFSSPELRQELVTTPVDLSRFALLAEPMYTSAEASEFNLTRFFTHLNSELVGDLESLCSLERPGGNAASNLGGNLLEAQAYRIKRSQLQERTGLHRKDAAFLRAFAAVRNYRLIVDQSPMDFCGCC